MSRHQLQTPKRRTREPRSRTTRFAFTLVEVLVALAIIGVLVGLLLAGVLAAREAAYRTQCASQVKQLALAQLTHAQAQGHFPTGGWGGGWVGDPDRGFGRQQPGGWAFNVLPYCEQQTLHELGRGAADKAAQAAVRLATPLELFHCPSRRASRAYPAALPRTRQPLGSAPIIAAARSDYAANSGDHLHCEALGFSGPANLQQGDRASFPWPGTRRFTGVGFLRSQITDADLLDGASNVYLLGEKHLSRQHYRTGEDHGDDWSLYSGFQDDLYRSTHRDWRPMPDRAAWNGYVEQGRFGSAHRSGWYAAMCDGSVRFVSYDLDSETHRRLDNRADGSSTPPEEY
jgi:prepilin-type N-terminal cleavage/methylation domain-containing protein